MLFNKSSQKSNSFSQKVASFGGKIFDKTFPSLGKIVNTQKMDGEKQEKNRQKSKEKTKVENQINETATQIKNLNNNFVLLNDGIVNQNKLLEDIIDAYKSNKSGKGSNSTLDIINTVFDIIGGAEIINEIRKLFKKPPNSTETKPVAPKPAPKPAPEPAKPAPGSVKPVEPAPKPSPKPAPEPAKPAPGSVKPVEPAPKPSNGVFNKIKKGVVQTAEKVIGKAAIPALAITACWEFYDRIKDLDPDDPKTLEKVTEEIVALTSRFGIVTISSILGAMAGTAIGSAALGVGAVPGSVIGFFTGLAAGAFADYALGDTVEEIAKRIVANLYKNKQNPIEKAKADYTNQLEEKQKQLEMISSKYESAGKAGNKNFQQNLEKQSSDITKDIVFLLGKIENLDKKIENDKIENKKVENDKIENKKVENLIKKITFEAKTILFEANEFSFGGEDTNSQSSAIRIAQGESGVGLTSYGSGGNMGATNSSNYMPTVAEAMTVNDAATINAAASTGEGLKETPGKEEIGDAQKVIAYFVSQGWTPEQAAGFAGNIDAESKFKTNEVGDGGAAYGLAQWHPDRQADFKTWAKKDIRESSFDEQLGFMNYELTQGKEKKAGAMIKTAMSAGAAAKVIDDYYERSDKTAQRKRIELAEIFYKSGSALNTLSTNDTAATTSQKNINITTPNTSQSSQTTGTSNNNKNTKTNEPSIAQRLNNL